jgi:hypothetical protein
VVLININMLTYCTCLNWLTSRKKYPRSFLTVRIKEIFFCWAISFSACKQECTNGANTSPSWSKDKKKRERSSSTDATSAGEPEPHHFSESGSGCDGSSSSGSGSNLMFNVGRLSQMVTNYNSFLFIPFNFIPIKKNTRRKNCLMLTFACIKKLAWYIVGKEPEPPEQQQNFYPETEPEPELHQNDAAPRH